MAQLEVPTPSSRGRHDLCPLDADPEAAPDRLSANFDRRLEGRRSHGRRHALRRRRRRSEGQAPGGLQGPGSGTHGRSGRLAGRTRSAAPAPAPASGRIQRAVSRDPRRPSPARSGRQARKGRGNNETAPAAPPSHGIILSRGRGGVSPGAPAGTRPSSAAGRIDRRHTRRPRPRHPAPAAGKPQELGRDLQRLQVLDHLPGELCRRRGSAGHPNPPRAGEPAEIEVFEPVDQEGGLLAELLDDLDQAE